MSNEFYNENITDETYNNPPYTGDLVRSPESDEKKDKKSSLFWPGVVIGSVLTLVVVFVAFIVFLRRYAPYAMDAASNDVAETRDASFVDDSVRTKLRLLENTIKKYFYLHEVDDKELEEGMYKGLLNSLEDPYSEYYTAAEFDDFMDKNEGIYYGIGAYVSIDKNTGLALIGGIIDDSPAQEADLRTDDIITEVDGESLYGLTLQQMVEKIKGPDMTKVTLTVFREGEPDYLTIEVTRRKVESPTVKSEMYDDGTAYIRVTEFDDTTLGQFSEALDAAKADNMKGLIIDLRSNPGGSLSVVVDMLRLILPKGLVVYTEDLSGKRDEYTCDGKNELQVPLVVLINGNSASASEVFSGAVKDYKKGTLVGTTTYGKGIVQQIFPMSDGSAIKLTISSYYTPSGKNIHGIGIEPDVECELDTDAYYDEENPVDTQLEKAKEVLKEKIEEQN
ncbi:MAG: S41 family peptidase [Lachnospiraceae bacterium]|nr:S41 family peptidase [Lachnospiraceae bacterium]